MSLNILGIPNCNFKTASLSTAEVNGWEVEDGDDQGDAPDSDEEKEIQRAARIRNVIKDETEDMPGTKAKLFLAEGRQATLNRIYSAIIVL